LTKKTAHKELEHALGSLQLGTHLCFIYETEEEHQAVMASYLRHGLERGDKVLYIVDAHSPEQVLDYLRRDGLPPEPYLERGQLVIKTADESYCREAVFDPDAMVALLQEETQRALAEGYAVLRGTGEMTWALGALHDSRPLLDYEIKLDAHLPQQPYLALCQYDRRQFPPHILRDVLLSHPVVILGTDVVENMYHLSPEKLLGADRVAAQLANWLENLARKKRTEHALHRSVWEFKVAAEHMPGIFSYLDADGRYRFVNQRYREWFQLTDEQIIGRHIREVLGEAAYKKIHHHVEAALSGQQGTYEGMLPYQHGGPRGVIASYVPDIDEDGTVRGFFALVTDITDRIRAEQKLREGESRYRLLADNVGDAVWTVDLAMRPTYISPSITSLLGYTVEEAREKKMEEVFAPASFALAMETLAEELAIEEQDDKDLSRSRVLELELIRKDGSLIPVEARYSFIRDAEGKAVEVLGVLRDITERKQAQEALELQAIKLEEANIALKVLLTQREKDKTDLEDRIMRNVTTLIVPYVERLKTTRIDPIQAAYVEIVASRLNELVSPFAQKLSSPRYNLTFRELQVADLIRQGKTTKEIALVLHLAPRTVKFHRQRLRTKLGLTDRRQNLVSHLVSLTKGQ